MEVPLSQEASLIGQPNPSGPDQGLTLAGAVEIIPHTGTITQAQTEGQALASLPANTNTAVIQIAFSGGNLLIQFWDQSLNAGVGGWATLATVVGVTKAIVTAKLCLMDATIAGQSWNDLSVSGDTIVGGWYEKNAKSSTTFRMIGAPIKMARDNFGSAPMVVTDQGGSMMVKSLPITRNAQLAVSSSRSMVAAYPALGNPQIPIEINVEVLA